MSSADHVLVVGAGPCGLAAACALAQAGVRVRVLEAQPRPRTGSRAILLWPPGLEMFRMLGVLEQAERRGVRARALNYRLSASRTIQVRLDPVNQPLLLPQADTEALLEAALREAGGSVERPKRVSEVRQGTDSVAAVVDSDAGQELLEADWLIAADGVRSTVREQLGIGFSGQLLPDTILVAEGEFEGELPTDELHYYLTGAGSALLVPLPDGRFRLGAPVDAEVPVSAALASSLVEERVSRVDRLINISAVTTYTGQERIADHMRLGRCFLVGDAAHTHSAIGGQGLNLGLQDVRNLSWKLLGVIDGRLRPEMLDTYEQERRYAAELTVQATHRLTRTLLTGSTFARWRRDAVLRLLDRTGILQRALPQMLAGWRLRYPENLAVAGTGLAKRQRQRHSLPAPGERTPHALSAMVPGVGGRLGLVTTGPPTGDLAWRGSRLASEYSDLLEYQHVPQPQVGFQVLRPDGYVAASGLTVADLEAAGQVLARLRADAGSSVTGQAALRQEPS